MEILVVIKVVSQKTLHVFENIDLTALNPSVPIALLGKNGGKVEK